MRLSLATASAAFVAVAFVLVLPAGAQQHAARRGASPAVRNPPRANQGHIPPPPPVRSNPDEPRQAEHLPTGHVNDTPHVNHDQWFGHESVHDARFHLAQPFAHGHFARVGPAYRYSVLRADANLHRVFFPGNVFFDIAVWDWPLCADWCWTCGDDFVVYDDVDHPGWYVLYNIHTGVYVHCQYMGS